MKVPCRFTWRTWSAPPGSSVGRCGPSSHRVVDEDVETAVLLDHLADDALAILVPADVALVDRRAHAGVTLEEALRRDRRARVAGRDADAGRDEALRDPSPIPGTPPVTSATWPARPPLCVALGTGVILRRSDAGMQEPACARDSCRSSLEPTPSARSCGEQLLVAALLVARRLLLRLAPLRRASAICTGLTMKKTARPIAMNWIRSVMNAP